MSSINKSVAKEIGAAVEEALAEVAEKFGLKVEVRGGSFDANSFRPKVEFQTAGAAEDEFRTYAAMYGLDPDDFGRKFVSKGRTFRVSGLATRSRTYPILATDIASSKTYKFTAEGAMNALAYASAKESGN